MPRLTIDNSTIEMPKGSTILKAARKLGLDVPSLCYLDRLKPSTSCMLCVVKVKSQNRLVPSCATLVEEGMEVESETEEVRQVRRAGLELLLSDHVGDCVAPCQNTCPANMDIPLMLRQVAAGELGDAIMTVKRDIALPAILGRVCPEPCEKTCRRRRLDSPAAICLVKRSVADLDLASKTPYLPPCRPSTDKKVAIVGSGPAGLAAAHHLLQMGHACTVIDERGEPGGMLRDEFDESQLPRTVLDAEIGLIEKLGARFRTGTKVGRDVLLEQLSEEYDAVLVAIGAIGETCTEILGLPVERGKLEADARTHQTDMPGVFAAGDAVSPSKLVVTSLADGKAAAVCIDQYLSGEEVTGAGQVFNSRAGRLSNEDTEKLAAGISRTDRAEPSGGPGDGLTEDQARTEAQRCLQCDCGEQNNCRLRKYASMYGVAANRYRGGRKAFERRLQHGDVVYESGKCIVCGLCVQIAAEAAEPVGLTFVGRGFDVRVGVPFDASMDQGITMPVVARRCADACPTGALTMRKLFDSNNPTCGACEGCPPEAT